uniref:Integrase catalytic domain-containing protein n=1 Tax=Vitis vinifera TaxID=29760 RepID=A5BMP5_VITVI|nr:hypothetical protein VITISV_037260 [Vitis vinifera]
MSSWGIQMELLRIATCDIAHSTRGIIQSGRHSTFSGYFTSGIPFADISHPDGRGGRFNFPVQTCPDPLIGYFTSGYLTVGWERRTFQLPQSCDRCQRLRKLTRRNQMPMNPILIVDFFDVWGIDFMGPFPMSFGNSYILVGVDYVSKWVEAIPCKHNDHKVVLKFLKENIFSRFGVPKAIISDGGIHFCNKPFETLLAKYGVKHKVATPYHPQTFGQVELANKEIKNILMKTILGMSPYRLVYGKACHLPMEVEYKAWCLDLNEMEELRNDAYINSKSAKQMMKRWHDQLISNKEFQKGQRVLLYDSRLYIFPGKLKSRWVGPFIIHQVHFNGVVELLNSNSTNTFKVNGHCLKPFMEPFNQDKEESVSLSHINLNQKWVDGLSLSRD